MKGLDRELLMNILSRAVGQERASAACEAFYAPASVSVRVNPSKVPCPDTFVHEHFGPDCGKVAWHPYGFFLKERPQFTLDPLFHAGCYYVQDSSAMAVGAVFARLLDECRKESNDSGAGKPFRVLDLCAAPGGKTTDLASSLRLALGDGFILVANEVMKNRASVLADNVAVWGDPNVVVTSVDPKAFAALEGFFDMIVTDVPCSGEGMFRKDEKAVEDWSEEAVNLCAMRQRRILADVWPSLRTGGTLLYSTCTFEEAENDDNVEWIAEELGGEVVECSFEGFPGVIGTRTGGLLVPGFVKGEGQFVSAVVKTSSCVRDRLPVKGRGTERKKGDLLIHIPETICPEADALEFLRPLQSGVALGQMKGTDMVPSADLALSIFLDHCGRNFPRADLDRADALRFLHRDTITLKDVPKGFVLVCFEGYPLGFVKNLGIRCNNLHPQNRRIRMDVQ